MNDDTKKQVQDPTDKAVPHDLSDHDELGEELAVEKHWDEESNDALTKAEKHLDEFEEDGVPLSDEDWEREEEQEEELPEHIEGAIDRSLEQMEEEEWKEEEDEEDQY